MNRPDPIDIDMQLADAMAECYADPLRHVMLSYPWGSGILNGRDGPLDWQQEYLTMLGNEVSSRNFNGTDPVAPLRVTCASGHGQSLQSGTICPLQSIGIISTVGVVQ